MKWTLCLVALLSLNLFAQEDSKDIEFGIDLHHSEAGPGFNANLGAESDRMKLVGGYGIAGVIDRKIGFVDVELKNYLDLGKSKKMRFLFSYVPLDLNASAYSQTTEALLKAKLGLKYKNTCIQYSFSPLSSFVDRTNDVSRASLYHGAELEQLIGNNIGISSLLKYGSIKGESSSQESGNYLRSRSELNYSFKNSGITLLAFYDLENFDYKTTDRSVANSPREIDVKNSLHTVGVGVRFNIGSKKE